MAIVVGHLVPVLPHGLVAEIKDVGIHTSNLFPRVHWFGVGSHRSICRYDVGSGGYAKEAVDVGKSGSLGAFGFRSRRPCTTLL